MLTVRLLLGDGGTTETIEKHAWVQLGSGQIMPTDNEWHHVAIAREAANNNIGLYIDGVAKTALNLDTSYGSAPHHPQWAIASDETFKDGDGQVKYYNRLEVGGEDIQIAELRIWNDTRTAQEISDYKDVIIDSDDSSENDNLVLHVPFNEGDGKSFSVYCPANEDVAGREIIGFMTPNEPYVFENTSADRHELRFTGRKCLAYPSLRPSFEVPEDMEVANHRDASEDGGYDGGLLWDTRLLSGATKASTVAQEGVFSGWAQLKIVLRQLKEGVIVGRLGLLYDPVEDKYRLFLINQTAGLVYTSNPVVDETWIGEEKTISVYFNGTNTLDPDDACRFWVDDTEETDDTPSASDGLWGFGGSMWSNSQPYEDTTNTNSTSGAIGGSTEYDYFGIAFDLVFLRQWWDAAPLNFSDYDSFVAATYNVDILPDDYRFIAKGLNGYISHDDTNAVFYADEFGFSVTEHLQYLVMPLNKYIREDNISYAVNGTDGYWYVYKNTAYDERLFKSDVLIRKVVAWPNGVPEATITAADVYYRGKYTDQDGSETNYGNALFFNGAILSNLVTEYDSEAFKKNVIKRPVPFEDSSSANAQIYSNSPTTVIEDKSPVQGSEQIGGIFYKSKYISLNSEGREKPIDEQRSRKPRWVTGPIDQASPMPVRGICRFRSEDGIVDKLLVVVGCSVYSIDTSDGTLTPEEFANIDLNDSEPVNFLMSNNKMLIMDSKGAIKINYKGNWSRLGIERPQSLFIANNFGSDNAFTDTTSNDVNFAYIAQFYDSENDVYSGTIPVYSELKQTIFIPGDQGGIEFVDIRTYGCLDKHVDNVYLWRTRDLDGEVGATEEFLLISVTGNVTGDDGIVKYRDAWLDSALTGAIVLPIAYYAVDLVPKPCKAISTGYGRIFSFNTEKQTTSLFWSETDGLGFPAMDMFPENKTIIIEEGGTTHGTALVEYAGNLFAFKDNAIFRIFENAPDDYSTELVYKGVGAVNQQSALVARESIFVIDRGGIYAFQKGEPQILTRDISGFFKNSVDQDNIDKSFMLYDKRKAELLAFVPSSGSTYCDRCIVFNFETGTVTIDLIPDVTCGFVDEDDVYLGSPYGQVFKYTDGVYKDGVQDVTIGLADSRSGTTINDADANFDTDNTLLGAPVYVVDAENKSIWKGVIISNTSSSFTVDEWESVFNTSGAPGGTLSYYIGGMILYEKTPVYAFLNHKQREKKLMTVKHLTNYQSSPLNLYTKVTINQDNSKTTEQAISHSGDLSVAKYLSGLHRHFQFEWATLVVDDFSMKELVFHVVWLRGEKDQ